MKTLNHGESNLGQNGVFRGAARMLTSNPKHLIQLSGALLLLPYAILVAFTYRQQVLSSAILWDLISGRLGAAEYYSAYAAAMADPAAANQLADITHQTLEPISFKHTWPSFLCSLFIYFVSMPALTVSLCRAYLNINAGEPGGQSLQSLKASLTAARKAWKSLFLTWLSTIVGTVGFMVVVLIGVLIVCVIVVLVASALTGPDLAIHVVLVKGIAMVVAGLCLLCLLAVWRLGEGVAVLEGRWGWRALGRSAHLVAGRSPLSTRSWRNVATALCLVVFINVANLLLTRLLAAAKDIPTSAFLTHVAVAVAVVASQSFIILINGLGTVLLYLSCRVHHQESLETLIASLAGGNDIPYEPLTSIEVTPPDTNHKG